MKRRIFAVIVFVLMTMSLYGCGGLGEAEQQCLNDLKIGLQDRWTLDKEASFTDYEEYFDNMEANVDVELEKMSQYKDIEFENQEFAEVINTYISALESQKAAIPYAFTDVDKYNELFYDKGRAVRSVCIKSLVDDYGFSVDKDFTEDLTLLMDSKEYRLIDVDEEVNVSDEYGELAITLHGFVSEDWEDNETHSRLLYEVENVSYEHEYDPTVVYLDSFITVFDECGYTLEASASGYQYNGYNNATAAYAEIPQGTKQKLVTDYFQTEENDMVCVQIVGNEIMYQCFIPVE